MSGLSLVKEPSSRGALSLSFLIRTRWVSMVNERPLVSFTFDGFPKSVVSSAADLLEANGAAGTYYLSRIFNGATVEGIEYYDLGDVERLIEKGHEIGCYTASNLRAPSVSRSELLADLDENARFARDHFGDVRLTSFAFPFGDIDLSTKFLMQARYASCRTTSPGVNHRVTDLGALRAEPLYSNLTSPQKVESLIKLWARPRSWLIFHTQDVAEHPSPNGCTPALFEAAVKSALAAGCQVTPVRGGLGAIRFRQSRRKA